MKVYYLSITSFSDVDMGIMHHLKPDAQIDYGVIIQKRNANYTYAELQSYCSAHEIAFEGYQMKYNLKDPRCLTTFIKIISSIKKSKADIIYIVTPDNIYLTMVSLLLNVKKTIIVLHDVEFHSNTKFALPLKLARWLTMWRFKNFQVYSREQLQLFKQMHPRKKVHFIPLPLKDFGTKLEPANKNDDVIRFLFFGNILYYKGLDLLLKAVNLLAEEDNIPSFKVVIAGRAADWATEYEPHIKHEHLIEKHVRFIGNDEVATLFTDADYLVLPYRDATQSGPLKIAFHYNIPVIASDINSFKEEVKDGVDGYLFKNGNVEALKNTLRDALFQHGSRYNSLKAAQLAYVSANYSPQKVKEHFLQMFRANKASQK